jgi:hypothetical protein
MASGTFELGDRAMLRLGAVAGVLGVVLVAVMEVVLHPNKAHPNNSRAAFREYAASDAFTAIHMGDYVGTLGIVLALVVLYRSLAPHQGPSGAAALVGVVAAVLVAAIFAVQMAVDGVALKAAVDDWVAAPKAQQDAAFRVADGIRDIEKGLSGFFQLTDGVALLGFGLAVALGRSYPRWLGVAGVLAGLGSLFGGWATALTGFSEEAQTFGLPTVVLLVVFVVGICVCLWRRSFHDGSLETGRTLTPTSRAGDQI